MKTITIMALALSIQASYAFTKEYSLRGTNLNISEIYLDISDECSPNEKQNSQTITGKLHIIIDGKNFVKTVKSWKGYYKNVEDPYYLKRNKEYCEQSRSDVNQELRADLTLLSSIRNGEFYHLEDDKFVKCGTRVAYIIHNENNEIQKVESKLVATNCP